VAEIKNLVDRMVKTDVLVVGGGGAGASAAVSAARAGSRVALAAKGPLGKSGNTIMSSAVVAMDGESAYKFGEKKADPALTKNVQFEKIIRHGFFLSEQKLVQQYVEEAAPRVFELLDWGKRAKQRFMFIEPNCWLTSGKAVGLACKKGVSETPGIELFEDVMICDLLINDGNIVGAVGVDIYTGELIAFHAGAVVLCTGGYQPFSFKCTHSTITGDGIAMAYRAGAKLADMEFLLFLPGVLLSPRICRGSIFPFLLNVAGLIEPDVVNAAGERISDQMIPGLVEIARKGDWYKLIHTYYWGKDIAAGKGTPNGGVYFDFSNFSKMKYLIGAFKASLILKQLYRRKWRYQGDNMEALHAMAKKGMAWEVGLSSEYSMGGIVVDETMGAGVPGLFAGGEITSGVFGASRTARALTEMLVQGYQAGQSATEYAKQTGVTPIDSYHLETVKERILGYFQGNGGIRAATVQNAIEATADSGFGFIRNEDGLRNTLQKIKRIREEDLPLMSDRNRSRVYNYGWIQALQVENLLICMEAGVCAALMRRESRGHHIRTDYPEVDHENWMVRIVIANENGRMTFSTRKPEFAGIPLPAGKNENIMEYAIACERELDKSGVQ